MKKQKHQRSSQPKLYDFNSMILAGRQSPIDNVYATQQDYNSKIKQIRALKRFEELFKKQYFKNQLKKQINVAKLQQNQYAKQSPHECSYRLKGMFFLRKRAEIQNKYRDQTLQQQSDDSQKPPIQGKTVSPSKAVSKQKEKVLNFVKTSMPIYSQKLYRRTLVPSRPNTKLQSSLKQQKIFNSQTLYSAILGANKVKLLGIRPANFVYFSVYVQEGNNSQMIKTAIRKRSGWKVVQMPAVANMVWSQFYKKSLDIKSRSKKNTQKQTQQSLQLSFQVLTSVSLLDQIRKKHKKFDGELQNKLNVMTKQQYNNQLHKICPKLQHLHRKPSAYINASNMFFYNHIPNNHFISDKKNLLINMKALYQTKGIDVFQVMPFSLNIDNVTQVDKILTLLPDGVDSSGYWIVKPGENSNRGRGIVVCKGIQSAISEINSRFNQKSDELPNVDSKQNIQQIKLRKQGQSIVLQKYIQPLLYFKRKFDIRMYMLVTNINKKIRGYVYDEGYIRTSSKFFTMENFNKFIHLTNDAIQTKSSDYGKFQQGNKVSWKKFQKWLEDEGHRQFWPKFVKDYKQICRNILESVQCSFTKKHLKYCSDNLLSAHKRIFKKCQPQKFTSIDHDNNIPNASNKVYFEVFGLDFLIDHTLKTWLIEVNTNPALTTDCSRVVNSLIPKMIQNTFSIAIQPFLKTSITRQFQTIKYENNFQVIFDDQWQN